MKKLFILTILLISQFSAAAEPELLSGYTNPLFDTYEEVNNLLLTTKLSSSSELLIGIVCLNSYNNVPGVAAVLYGHVDSEGEKVFEGMLTDYGSSKRAGRSAKFGNNMGIIQKNPFKVGGETDLFFYDAYAIVGLLQDYDKNLPSIKEMRVNREIDDYFWAVDRANLTISQNSILPFSKSERMFSSRTTQFISYDLKCEVKDAKILYQDMVDAENKDKAKKEAEKQKRKENVKF